MERSVRLLLTLLVVLSGLAAVPAEARSRTDGASGIEQVQPLGNDGGLAVACAGRVAQAAATPRDGGGGLDHPLTRQVTPAVAVREGDRALE